MRTTQQFSITLTHEMAQLVRGKVESGEYASESEVVRDIGAMIAQRDSRDDFDAVPLPIVVPA